MDANNVEENGTLNGKIKEQPSEPSSKAKEFFKKRWFLLFVIFLILFVIVSVIVILVFLIPHTKREVERNFRLPLDVIPQHYSLEIRPHLDHPDDFRFDGNVVITFYCANTTDTLILHSVGLNVQKDNVDVTSIAPYSSLMVLKIEYNHQNHLIIFTLCENLKAGVTYNISIEYDGKINLETPGFFAVKYEEDGVDKYAAATKFERIYARRAFPCFDEPSLKSEFTISIVRKREHRSLSNMPLLETIIRDEEWEEDKYRTSVAMPTYLVAFAIGEFTGIRNEKVGVWFLNRTSNIDYQSILDTSRKLLSYFERYLKIDYNLPKLDQLFLPNYPSPGMENLGLIMYNELMFKLSRLSFRSNLRLISHEIAHQWFGNLVSPKWWDELWLNEGFATYFSSLGLHGIHPEWRMDEAFVYLSDSLECDEVASPVKIPINKQADFSERLGIIYQKGGRIVRMIHKILGDNDFREGLKTYLALNAYGSVDQNELWDHLTKAQTTYPQIKLKERMEPWILHRGYPIITAIRDYQKHEMTLTQTSCLNYENITTDDVWNVPITLMHGSGPVINLKIEKWLTERAAIVGDLPREKKWVLINVEQLGYFRVNYDKENWKLLLWQLRHKFLDIPSLNRIQILKDVMFFADKGDIAHTVALDIFSYFPYEKDPLVLNVIGDRGIGKHLKQYEISVFKTDIEKTWKKFIHYALEPIYTRHLKNWAKGEVKEKLLFSWKKYIDFLCMYGHRDCLNSASELMRDLILNKKKFDEMDLRTSIGCSFVRHGNINDWKNVFERYKESENKNEKMFLSAILSCANDYDLIQRYVEDVWSPGMFIFYDNFELRVELIEYLHKKWSSFSKDEYMKILRPLMLETNDIESYEMMKDFYEKRKEDFKDEQKREMEKIMEKRYTMISKWKLISKSIILWLKNENWLKIIID